jgi:hypothetical protein
MLMVDSALITLVDVQILMLITMTQMQLKMMAHVYTTVVLQVLLRVVQSKT